MTHKDRRLPPPEGRQGEFTWLSGGGVASPEGFVAAGVHSGIKRRNLDLALLATERPASVAGALTLNQVQAAPVHYCREILERGTARAVLVNSGNANACTGEQGMEDTRAMAKACAAALGVDASEVLVASTGVIGVRLDMPPILAAVPTVAAELGAEDARGAAAAEAILTTDTVPKAAALQCETSSGTVTLGGMTKGSGMIAPAMAVPHATTLAFVTCDAAVDVDDLRRVLARANEATFNSITVDGDTSTNDTLCVLANGAAGGPSLKGEDLDLFERALTELLGYLARSIVYDGEGATRLIEVRVVGAQSEADARAVAQTVANSPLVKTAFHSGEPNWGRFLMATGRAPAAVEEARVSIALNGTTIVEGGRGCLDDLEVVAEGMRRPEVVLQIDLGLGSGTAAVWTCDLSQQYVHINASYIS
ncbi:MAG: bifunctional glutamate N-acetyltransferase/amino-acid acetyltransferase ArgJ [Acidobacteriota bacterium]